MLFWVQFQIFNRYRVQSESAEMLHFEMKFSKWNNTNQLRMKQVVHTKSMREQFFLSLHFSSTTYLLRYIAVGLFNVIHTLFAKYQTSLLCIIKIYSWNINWKLLLFLYIANFLYVYVVYIWCKNENVLKKRVLGLFTTCGISFIYLWNFLASFLFCALICDHQFVFHLPFRYTETYILTCTFNLFLSHTHLHWT